MQTETSEVNIVYSNKTYVRVGRKYKKAFQSICDLVNSGCVDRSIVLRAQVDRVIETEQYVFEYNEEFETVDTGAELGLFPGGATWFSGFRGGESDNAMGIWYDLLELVATNYHREYSFVEYIREGLAQTGEEIRKHKNLIEKMLTFLGYNVSDVAIAAQEDSVEDVYALSMRIEVFSGAGEPKPLLCKVYFRKRNGVFIPIHKEEAEETDTYINNIVCRRSDNDQAVNPAANAASVTDTVDGVLNALDNQIHGNMHLRFDECMIVTNDLDKQNFSAFLGNEINDDVQLECRKIKVLGISHVQWVDPTFYVYVDNVKAFLAKIDVNDTITLLCRCDAPDNKLIERNSIVCRSEQTGRTEKLHLNPDFDDFGISEEQLTMIREQSAFADHFMPISCPETRRRGIECMRYLCKCNALAFNVNGTVRYKCPDCPYPEVVYHGEDGKPMYTPSLYFDADSLRAVTEETEICRFCGRTYAKEAMDTGLYCRFCASAEEASKNGMATETEKKAYRLYSGMIPLSVRMKNLFGQKSCFENADRLIFFVGKKKFFFDKLDLNESGKLKSPEER